MIRAVGLVVTVVYAAAIVWAYTSQPQSGAEAIGGLAFTVGAYRIDQQAFQDALGLFRHLARTGAGQRLRVRTWFRA